MNRSCSFLGFLVSWWVIFTITGTVNGSAAERKLLAKLLDNYNPLERPTETSKDILNVTIMLTLQSINSIDIKESTMVTCVWLTLEWRDFNLRWDQKENDGITEVKIPLSKMWQPDVYAYNSAHEAFHPFFETKASIKANGSIVYISPAVHKISCKFDLTYYPYDRQTCTFKFGSWAYDGGAIDLHLAEGMETVDTSTFIPSSEWELLSAPAYRNAIYYACCPDPFVDVTFVLKVRRKGAAILSSYKIVNAFICLLILLSFAMPSTITPGPKLVIGAVALFVSIYTSSSLNSILSPDSNSWLGSYFSAFWALVFSSIVLNLLTMFLYYQTCAMPKTIKRLLDKILASCCGSLICVPKIASRMMDENGDDVDLRTTTTVSNEDNQQQMIFSEINRLKKSISSIQRPPEGWSYSWSDWSSLSVVLDRTLLIIYAVVVLVFVINLFPSDSALGA